ncbi:uncharacterized protein LOC135840377 [Planococcus citri]|uniref:uncharacterized protein LOC135840377 n=1 Tax=Planococcus citri TaxID=170843 RepID=UPI0031F943A3
MMEITELERHKLTSAYTLVGSCISVQNLHAVIIRTGIHIMEIVPNLSSSDKCVTMHRSLIKTPNDFPIPDISVDLKSLNREEFCMLHLDHKLVPHDDKITAPDVFVKQICWIPVQDTTIRKPALGILTNRTALHLYLKSGLTWKKFADVSSIWNDYCFKKWFPNPTLDAYAEIEKKFKYIRISNFTSCDGFLYQDGSSSLIATVSESGIIALWSIPENMKEKSPHVVTILETNLSVQYLYWHKLSNKKGWLIVACYDGLLKLYSCEEHEKETLTVKFEYEVWKYADLMAIINLKIKDSEDGKSLMAFSKENVVLLFSLGKENIQNEHFYEFEQKVAGLEILDDRRIFVVLCNNKTYELFLGKSESVSKECCPVTFNHETEVEQFTCYGVSFSKNKLWAVFYLKFSLQYDHLILRDPHCLLLCTVNPKNRVTPSTLEPLIKNPITIYDLHDYIEYLRIQCLNEPEIGETDKINITWDYLNGDIEICRKFFQLSYILMKCYCLSKSSYYEENKSLITSVEIIFMVCNFLFYQEKITAIRKQYFFYKWLADNVSKLPDTVLEYQRFKKIKDMMNNFTDVCFDEKCDLCTSSVKDYGNLKYVICDKGHRVLRCSFSFLPITDKPTKECTLCYSTVLQSEGTNRCMICDNVF